MATATKGSFYGDNATVYTESNPPGPASAPIVAQDTPAPSSFFRAGGEQYQSYEAPNIYADQAAASATAAQTAQAAAEAAQAIADTDVATIATTVTLAAGAAQKASNLSDLVDAPTARTNLGLGDSATKNVGTTAGTVAAGDDSRIKPTGTTAGTLAAGDDSRIKATGTTAGTLAAGDDSRITGALQKANNLSGLTSVSTALTNLGLSPTNQVSFGAVRSGNFTMADGTAVSIAVPGNATNNGCIIAIHPNVAPTSLIITGLIFARVRGTAAAPVAIVLNSGATPGFTTGVLSGTTFTAGNYNFSVNNDGNIYIENRTGAAHTFAYTIIGTNT